MDTDKSALHALRTLVIAALVMLPAGAFAKGSKETKEAVIQCTKVTNLIELKIKQGSNDVDGNPGEAGLKILWLHRMSNFATENYNAYAVFLGSFQQGGTLIRFKNPITNNYEDLIRDNPYDGERHIRSVAFAHGRCNGRVAFFLVTATKNPQSGPADAGKVTFEIFDIKTDDFGFDAWFERISTKTSEQAYGSSEDALVKEYGFSMGR